LRELDGARELGSVLVASAGQVQRGRLGKRVGESGGRRPLEGVRIENCLRDCRHGPFYRPEATPSSGASDSGRYGRSAWMQASLCRMRRYAAFLRGVSPTNVKMPELAACFTSVGFTDVKTVLSSGNVVFSATRASEAALASIIEKAMTKCFGRSFLTIVRSIDDLQALLDKNPFASFRVTAAAKPVVTFLREKPKSKVPLPVEREGAQILAAIGSDVFTVYVPSPLGPVFMQLIKQTFGDGQTTRTWNTIGKVVKAAARTVSAKGTTKKAP
jgi:uncharacterized protein (DUF1697 family)